MTSLRSGDKLILMEYKLIIITIAFLVIPLAVVLFLSSKDTGTLDDMKWNLSQKDTKGKIKYLLGVACCIFAFFDFIFSYGGINLAPFLGGLAVVSPIIFIAVGTILMGTSGKSRQWQTQYLLSKNSGTVSIECNDWSEELKTKEGYTDNLSISIYSKEYENFVRYEAYS